MSYSSFKIILIHVKHNSIITATLILNYLNNSERSLVKQILIEDEIIVCATYLIPDIEVEEKNTCLRAYLSIVLLLDVSDGGYASTTKGALLGAGVGLLTGNGVNGVLKGAAVGAGVGAVTEKGRDGKNARKGAKVGVCCFVLSLAF